MQFIRPTAQLMATERKETNNSFCRSNSFVCSEVYLPERSWRIYFTVVCLTFRRALYGTSKRGRDFVRGGRRRDGDSDLAVNVSAAFYLERKEKEKKAVHKNGCSHERTD